MNDDQLRSWAEAHVGKDGNPGSPLAEGVLRLLDESKRLQQQIMEHCERIVVQSELLSRRAELPAPGTYTIKGGQLVPLQS